MLVSPFDSPSLSILPAENLTILGENGLYNMHTIMFQVP